MALATKTLKLPFLRLNQAKAAEFLRLQTINTELADRILDLPKKARRALTTKSFQDVEIGSAWINQTIRNANAATKVKRFKTLPLETNNQNWTLHKTGETFSVAFGIRRGIRKRIPLEVHQAGHQEWLAAILNGTAKQGSIKLWRSRRGIWFVLISCSIEVPEPKEAANWIGVDRGQNIPAVAALPDNGRLFFFKANRIKQVRRIFAERRKQLQSTGKHRAVRKLERRERRIVTHINHKLSKELVGLAERFGCGLRFEDLTGIRQNTKQRENTKSKAAENRDFWPFYQLELFSKYKAVEAGVPVENRPAPYTSRTHRRCGHLGIRKGLDFFCPHCNQHEHADANAARNIGAWVGLFCVWEPSMGSFVMDGSASGHGVYDSPPNSVRDLNPQGLGEQE